MFRGTAQGVHAGTLRTCALLRELHEPRYCYGHVFHGDAHIHVGVDTWIETMETVENYERVPLRNVDNN